MARDKSALTQAAHLTLRWDATASMKGADVGKFLNFMKLWLAKERPGVKTRIFLHVLRNAVQPPVKVDVTPDNLGKLEKVLRSIDYDGATLRLVLVSLEPSGVIYGGLDGQEWRGSASF